MVLSKIYIHVPQTVLRIFSIVYGNDTLWGQEEREQIIVRASMFYLGKRGEAFFSSLSTERSPPKRNIRQHSMTK